MTSRDPTPMKSQMTTDRDGGMPFDVAKDADDGFHDHRNAENQDMVSRPTVIYKQKEQEKFRPKMQFVLEYENMLKKGKEIDSKQQICDAFHLNEAMEKQKKEKGHKLVEYKDSKEGELYLDYFDIESKNPKIDEQIKESNEYAKRQIDYDNQPDIDTFIINEFSVNGMKNIYGDSQQEFKDLSFHGRKRQKFMSVNKQTFPRQKFELIDCKVTTYFHEDLTYFVVVGYQKGYKQNDWTYAQGRTILRIYQMDPKIEMSKRGNEKGDILPEVLILDEVLNNVDFRYTGYKNHNPVMINDMCVYYYKVSNHYHGDRTTQHMIDMWLYKVDLKPKNSRLPKKELVLRWYDENDDWYIAHHSFITPYPDLNISNKELELTGGAIMYFREWNHDRDQYLDEDSSKYYQKIMRVGMCKANKKFEKVQVKGLDPEEDVDFEIPSQFLENEFPQPQHMWIMKNGKLIEVSGDQASNDMYHEIKSNFLSKPYYLYKLEDGLHNKYMMARYDENQDFSKLDKLVDVFQILDEDHPENKCSGQTIQGKDTEHHQMELSAVKDQDVERGAECKKCRKELLRHEEFYNCKHEHFETIKNLKTGKDEKISVITHEDWHRGCVEDNADNSSDDEDQTYNELQSINIIDDKEDFEFSVFYVYGSQVEFKRYRDQRHRPMTKYVYNDLHYFSKFAQRYNQGKVDEIYKNVFSNNYIAPKDEHFEKLTEAEKAKYGKKAFMITKDGEVLKTPDEKMLIYPKDDKNEDKYFVYDLIFNGTDPGNADPGNENRYEKRYNIARLENKADNPFIRFKIVGGWNEGLSIRFSRFDTDEKIHDFKIMTYFSEEKYQNAGLAWSSSLYKMDPEQKKNHANKFCQNLQWAQMSPDQIYCKIIEYEISWPSNIMTLDGIDHLYCNNEHSHGKFQINVIGMKVVLFNNIYDRVKPRNWFYSMYDEKNDEIIGTQWIPDSVKISIDNERDGIFYQLQTYEDSDYQYETKMVRSCLYVYYSNVEKQKDKNGYIVIESQIADNLDKHYHSFARHEVLDILNTELRCLLNMKLTTQDDVIDVNVKIEDYDFLQSMECLGRYSIADFFLLNPEQIQKFTSKVDPHKIYKNFSILDDFIKSKGNLQSHRNFFHQNGLLRIPGSVAFDRNHSNTMFRCFDNGTTLEKLQKEQKVPMFKTYTAKLQNAISRLCSKKADEEINFKRKQKAVLYMSGNHILNYVLKKKPTSTENRFIFFLLDIFIDEGIQIESFFENESQYGYFVKDIFHKQFCSLIEMDSIPASSNDVASIRILGDKHKLTKEFDENDNISMLERYFSSINQSKETPTSQDQIKAQIKKSADKLFQNKKESTGVYDNCQHKIQSFIFDRSSISLDYKRVQLLNIITEKKGEKEKVVFGVTPQKEWDFYDLSLFLDRVNLQYGKHCEKHHVLMKLIDALFNDSKYFYYKQIFAYILYMVPFFMQLLWYDHLEFQADASGNWYDATETRQIIICNICCMVVCTGFFIIELIQISILGLGTYWSNSRSFEIFWFPIQLLYFYQKLNYPEESYPLLDYVDASKIAGVDQSLRVMMGFAVLNSILLVLIGLKMFYFLTIFSRFGTMIKLIQQTLGQIQLFFCFYMLMLWVFSCIMMCLGYDVTGDDIVGQLSNSRRIFSENSVFQYFTLNFLNSVGQVSAPDVYLWVQIRDSPEKKINGITENNSNQARFMIFFVWVFWIVIVIFLFIILINFMVAYISQSYEDVLEKKINNIYHQRCDLNSEYYLFRRFLHNISKSLGCCKNYEMKQWSNFILSADFEINLGNSAESGNVGIIKNVQTTLALDKEEIKFEIQQNRAEMERVKDEMRAYRYEMTKVIEGLPFIKDEITSNFKSLLAKNNSNLMWELSNQKQFKPFVVKPEKPKTESLSPKKDQSKSK